MWLIRPSGKILTVPWWMNQIMEAFFNFSTTIYVFRIVVFPLASPVFGRFALLDGKEDVILRISAVECWPTRRVNLTRKKIVIGRMDKEENYAHGVYRWGGQDWRNVLTPRRFSAQSSRRWLKFRIMYAAYKFKPNSPADGWSRDSLFISVGGSVRAFVRWSVPFLTFVVVVVVVLFLSRVFLVKCALFWIQ